MNVIQLKQKQEYVLEINLKFGILHEIYGNYNKLLIQYMNLLKLMAKNESFVVKLEYENTTIAFDILNVISFELLKDEGNKNNE
jgi:hypothetical protein